VFLRVIRARARAGRVDELAARWQSQFVPGLVRLAGFRRAWFAGDRDLSTFAVVTLWDDLPRANQLGPMIVAFEERQVSDLLAAPAVIEEFEVLAEAEAEAMP
jgi:hypothetical protein